jgi:hypothetical protein
VDNVIRIHTCYMVMMADSSGRVWASSVHDTQKEADEKAGFMNGIHTPDQTYEVWESRYTVDPSMPSLDEATEL